MYPPSWWEALWFKSIVALCIVFLVWMFIRLRLGYLKRKNENLEQMVGYRTAELHKIIGMLEKSEGMLGKQLNYQKRLNENTAHDISTPLKYLTLSAKGLLHKIQNNEYITEGEAQQVYEGAQRIYTLTLKLVYVILTMSQNIKISTYIGYLRKDTLRLT